MTSVAVRSSRAAMLAGGAHVQVDRSLREWAERSAGADRAGAGGVATAVCGAAGRAVAAGAGALVRHAPPATPAGGDHPAGGVAAGGWATLRPRGISL